MEQSKLFESQEQKAGAEFSKDRKYRYRLWREWNKTKPAVLFVMLNPSTADELVLDSTVSRCLSFAKEWGYGRLEVANLFALRATDPKELNKVEDPVGGSLRLLQRDHAQQGGQAMSCTYCHNRGRLAKVTVPGFDGKTVTKTMEICEAVQKILESRTVKK